VQAAKLAARDDLQGGAGSDAHDPEGIGAAYLEMPGSSLLTLELAPRFTVRV
jgi:hypothetical protein